MTAIGTAGQWLVMAGCGRVRIYASVSCSAFQCERQVAGKAIGNLSDPKRYYDSSIGTAASRRTPGAAELDPNAVGAGGTGRS